MVNRVRETNYPMRTRVGTMAQKPLRRALTAALQR